MIGDTPWRRKRNTVVVWADVFPQISFLPIDVGAHGSRLCLHSHGVKTGDERRAGTGLCHGRGDLGGALRDEGSLSPLHFSFPSSAFVVSFSPLLP